MTATQMQHPFARKRLICYRCASLPCRVSTIAMDHSWMQGVATTCAQMLGKSQKQKKNQEKKNQG